MSTFEPAVLRSWRGWPDFLEGPYFLVFHWALTPDGQRVECVGVDLRTYADEEMSGVKEGWRGPRAEDASARTITTDVWRSLRLGELVDSERRAFAEQIGRDPQFASWAATWRRPRPRGLHLARGDHRAVADIYLEAMRAGDPPRQAVADTFGISPSSAANRIARARAHGLLPATTRGRTHTREGDR